MARTINGVTVDPLVQRDELADASLIAEDASQSNYRRAPCSNSVFHKLRCFGSLRIFRGW